MIGLPSANHKQQITKTKTTERSFLGSIPNFKRPGDKNSSGEDLSFGEARPFVVTVLWNPPTLSPQSYDIRETRKAKASINFSESRSFSTTTILSLENLFWSNTETWPFMTALLFTFSFCPTRERLGLIQIWRDIILLLEDGCVGREGHNKRRISRLRAWKGPPTLKICILAL